jgi:arylformamidase
VTTPDYDAEYNNRARVPEHPAIIEGWARDAAAYRDAARSRYERLTYGGGERHVIDLFEPETPRGGATVVFIHGGYWQALHPSFFSHLARGPNGQGLTVAIPGYDLCPQVGVGDILDQVRRACATLAPGGPLVAVGHSAGGHLAACLLATGWPKLGLAPDLVGAAYAISGLFDLEPLVRTQVNAALRMSDPQARRLSPAVWPPPTGRIFDAIVGAEESSEYRRQSRDMVDRRAKGGVAARYEEAPGANHFTVIAPLSEPDSGMTRRIADLARR